MSINSDFSLGSDGEDLLNDVEKHVQLISTSTDTPPNSDLTSGKKSEENAELMNEIVRSAKKVAENIRQSHLDIPALDDNLLLSQVTTSSPLTKKKLYASYQDLLTEPLFKKSPKTNKLSKKFSFKRSHSCVDLDNKKTSNNYSHIQSKVKKYIEENKASSRISGTVDTSTPDTCLTPKNSDVTLEEINKKLAIELKEKDEILHRMQENYENLLLKYAEAQNRIDQLRFRSGNDAEYTSSGPKTPNFQITNLPNDFVSNNSKTLVESVESKCQKAIVAPMIKSEHCSRVDKSDDFLLKLPEKPCKQRPLTLPLENNLNALDRENINTPTDSEGVSSVITSMSGHSKILNTLDEEAINNQVSDDAFLTEEILRMSSNEYDLDKSISVNDSYDKVKNWQNSLPPLDLIETPETNLYDTSANNTQDISPSTNYRDINESVRNKNKPTNVTFLPDEFINFKILDSEEPNKKNRVVSQEIMRKYLRTLSLPSTLSKRNLMSMIYKHKSHHTIDVCVPLDSDFHNFSPKFESQYLNISEDVFEESETPDDIYLQPDVEDFRNHPPFMRASSLPVYDYESPKTGKFQNNIFIPQLDLENLTLSEDETTREKLTGASKSNNNTSASFIGSHGGSPQISYQTQDSVDSCKATVSQFSDFDITNERRSTFHKSTSITPDRSKDMIFQVTNNFNNDNLFTKVPKAYNEMLPSNEKYPNIPFVQNRNVPNFLKSSNTCNICGEVIFQSYTDPITGRSASYQSIYKESVEQISRSIRRTKYPFNRSVSFMSDIDTPKCFHDDCNLSARHYQKPITKFNSDHLDEFDMYTNHLKARSQVIMKALTAHVNHT